MEPNNLQYYLDQLEQNSIRIDREINKLKQSNFKWELTLIIIGFSLGVFATRSVYTIMEICK